MIPKRIFAFWGGEKMSWIRYMTLYSFRKLNPDWQIDLYNVEDNGLKKVWSGGQEQDFFAYQGPDYFDRVKDLDVNIIPWEILDPQGNSWADKVSISQQSNFCKWQVLGTDGGLYMDMDILWTKPIDAYYEEVKDKDVAICGSPYLSIGFLGASPGCQFFQDAWCNAFKHFYPGSYQTAGVESLYKFLGNPEWWALPDKPVRVIQGMYPDLKVHNNMFELVYPFAYNEMEEVWMRKHIALPPETIGIHWYAGARLSQQYNRLLHEEVKYENTFTYWQRKLT